MPVFFKSVSDIWHKLIGSSEDFSFETRIFHSISVGLVLLTAIYAPHNFYDGLYAAGISAVLTAAFFFYQYYNSRFRGKTYSTAVFALTGIVIFSVNYFLNAGIDGSTDLIWPAYLLLVLAISPYRQHLLWVVTYLVAFLIVHIVEYKYPSLIQHPFDMGRGKFVDRITAFPMPVIAIAIIIIFIRRSYDVERAAVEEKAETIKLRNEQILEQKNQLEESNAEKNKLLSIISHDMRAPFSHIQGYLQMLSQIEIGSQERLDLEKELLNTTDQTIEMLSNLLYWSRSQMEGVVANLAEINLLSSIHNTLEIGKSFAAKKRIELRYNIGTDIAVMADANMLQLVVRNLINNAIKFTHEGGLIDVHTQVLTHVCKITVSDNGTGIEAGKKATLFSMTSGSTYGTNNEKGVGLGLPLCKEFMELQGGHIDFDSTPGKGSSFYISIPLAQQAATKAGNVIA